MRRYWKKATLCGNRAERSRSVYPQRKKIPFAEPAECVEDIRTDTIEMLGYPEGEYKLYDDDGVSTVTEPARSAEIKI